MAKPENDQEIYGAPLDLPETSSTSTVSRPGTSKKSHRKLVVTIIIIIILATGAALYFFLLRTKPSSDTPAKSDQSSATTNAATEKQATDYKKHTGDFPRMELTYPSTWILVEKDNGVTVSSPDFTYTTTDKGEVKGNFSVYIRQGAREQEGKYIGRGMAVQPTEKLVYKEPSSTQRSDTNLTLFGLDSADYFSFFLVSGDYELKKGETLGPTYGREAETYIIAGGFGSTKQTDPLDYNDLEVKEATSNEAYKQGIDIIKSLKVY